MSNKIKVVTVVGTRPEIIRLSRTIIMLDKYVNHILIHTGQNYDYELNEIFFKDLEIRKPDYFLEIDISTLGSSVGDIIRKSEAVLIKENPDALLVLGDTNSCLSAYMARRLKIPIYHMEAGNRCFDFNVPEEINRRLIDHIADFNLVYTEHARRHLISEGLPQRRIYLTGSPMFEVLGYYKSKIEQSKILRDLKLEKQKYLIVSTHREENVDNTNILNSILSILNKLAEEYNFPIIVSTHPRTQKRIEEFPDFKLNNLIKFFKPFGFTDFIQLQINALCTISDSGTINEESAILGFPAISLRNSMERPEALDAGTIILTGFDERIVLNSIQMLISKNEKGLKKLIPVDYTVPDTSRRVVKLILGTCRLNNIWSGIHKDD
jgi:UDP-N-acetylglucosamine 2-epimerase